MTQQTITHTTVSTHSGTQILKKFAPVLFSVLLGAVILAGVGFAPGMAHNAAHDTRHVMVFPCH